MCLAKAPQIAQSQSQPPAPTATQYVSPEADPSSPNSTANAVSRSKLRINLAAPGSGLQIPGAGAS